MLYDVLVQKGAGSEYHDSYALGNALRKAESLFGDKKRHPGSEVAIRSESGKVIIF